MRSAPISRGYRHVDVMGQICLRDDCSSIVATMRKTNPSRLKPSKADPIGIGSDKDTVPSPAAILPPAVMPQSAMENLLTKYPKGQIQGVFTVNDEAALGAIEAIDAAGRTDEISVVGIDGNKDAAQAILEGRILATVSDDPWAKGYQAVKALVEYKTGQKIPDVLPIQARIIDKSNAADLLKHFPEMDAYYKP